MPNYYKTNVRESAEYKRVIKKMDMDITIKGFTNGEALAFANRIGVDEVFTKTATREQLNDKLNEVWMWRIEQAMKLVH